MQTDSTMFHLTLHSNMFLLIRSYSRANQILLLSLHSNMFLLIHIVQCSYLIICHFTFQYVSINTWFWIFWRSFRLSFTFQYVSINTRSSEPPINSSILYHILSTMIFFYLFIYFDITRFTGSTILLMFFTFVDLS